MHRIAKLAVLATAAVAFSATGATAAQSYIYNSFSQDLERHGVDWATVMVCDGDQDGNWVKAHYARDNGSTRWTSTSGGQGTCSVAEVDTTNRITKHRSQQIRDWATDPYGPWKYRP
ncbi:hypothetical protein AB0D46_35805 [Streptomyces sp. NPDC048383]|uniref:hypothetical protein n=1 Tax=Streptomyces sp. NPDC048383 TaxID=3155386 RepID=UPI00341E4084